MTKTNQKLDLINQINNSQAIKLLIPAYQQALVKLANSRQLALKKALEAILRQENTQDAQTIEFTEITLEGFIERNLPAIDQAVLHNQLVIKAERLLRTFLFFTSQNKAQIAASLPGLTIIGLKKFIDTMRQGHHKQSEYLSVFAQKDPKSAIKFEVIASGKFQKSKTKTTKS